MFNLIKKVSFKNHILIVPSISIGNVGQLTADLLITNLKLEKVGTLWDPAITPILGADPYNNKSTDLSVACELYTSESNKLSVLQVRSSIDKKLLKKFMSKLSDLIKENEFGNVIILTSCFAYEKHAILSSPFRYLYENISDDLKSKINELDLQKLEKIPGLERSNHGDEYIINGGGYALKLMKTLSSKSINCLLIMKYCSEGDNIPDAIASVGYLNKLLNVIDDNQHLKSPPSWYLLYGGPPPVGIY